MSHPMLPSSQAICKRVVSLDQGNTSESGFLAMAMLAVFRAFWEALYTAGKSSGAKEGYIFRSDVTSLQQHLDS